MVKGHAQVASHVPTTVTLTNSFDVLVDNEVNGESEVDNGGVHELDKHGEDGEPSTVNG